jgi:transposase-like protein
LDKPMKCGVKCPYCEHNNRFDANPNKTPGALTFVCDGCTERFVITYTIRIIPKVYKIDSGTQTVT